MNNNSVRFPELDLLRGLAVIGMIIFHLFFILYYFDVVEVNIYGGGWLLMARFVQFSFLGLVGICLSLSFQKNKSAQRAQWKYYLKQWRRALMVFFFALLITLVTHLFAGDDFVRFGVLHFIAFSILVLPLFAGKKNLLLLLGIGSILLGFLLKKFSSISLLPIIIGFRPRNFNSLDHFPVFPWLGIVALGMYIGLVLYRGNIARHPFKFKQNKFLTLLSKNTLWIYLIHVPLIVFFLIILRIIYV